MTPDELHKLRQLHDTKRVTFITNLQLPRPVAAATFDHVWTCCTHPSEVDEVSKKVLVFVNLAQAMGAGDDKTSAENPTFLTDDETERLAQLRTIHPSNLPPALTQAVFQQVHEAFKNYSPTMEQRAYASGVRVVQLAFDAEQRKI